LTNQNSPPAIAAFGIDKSFGATRALAGADLAVARGEIVALMGANGAGKSTLVKIMSGTLDPDAGRVEVAGKAVSIPSPQVARKLGIATVHQQTSQAGAPGLTVAENLLLDELCSGASPAFLPPRSIRRRAAEIAAALDLDLALDRDFAELRPAERQLIAIARAVAAKSSVLILDEPTSTLSAAEAERLFGILERLRGSGIGILYISHRLGDLARIADRAVVLRGGQVVGAFGRPIDFQAAVGAMIGRPLEAAMPAGTGRADAPAILSLRSLRLIPGSAPFDLDVREGEVVAITGALGSGKSRLLRGLFGLEGLAGGEVSLQGKNWKSDGPAASITGGVYMVAEDRWASSLFPATTLSGTIAGAISFPHLARWFGSGVVRTGRERAAAARAISRLGIRARGPDDTLEELSGGNQQKVVLARWQAEPCRLLLLDEPFQGVDVGARADLIAAIRGTQQGAATLIATSDPEEALEVADRIFVMRDHTLVSSTDTHRKASILTALDEVESAVTSGTEP
jgi:simple sugar transport system ATP-binding protein